mmetsp:Transcript_7404/g.22957  ORF Transcript_7404/g.22957 Transcript_7404/m.22957 type:complete len:283 (-) Transcript_7404:1154-2002(-)
MVRRRRCKQPSATPGCGRSCSLTRCSSSRCCRCRASCRGRAPCRPRPPCGRSPSCRSRSRQECRPSRRRRPSWPRRPSRPCRPGRRPRRGRARHSPPRCAQELPVAALRQCPCCMAPSLRAGCCRHAVPAVTTKTTTSTSTGSCGLLRMWAIGWTACWGPAWACPSGGTRWMALRSSGSLTRSCGARWASGTRCSARSCWATCGPSGRSESASRAARPGARRRQVGRPAQRSSSRLPPAEAPHRRCRPTAACGLPRPRSQEAPPAPRRARGASARATPRSRA